VAVGVVKAAESEPVARQVRVGLERIAIAQAALEFHLVQAVVAVVGVAAAATVATAKPA
jgi:hypothetical protein